MASIGPSFYSMGVSVGKIAARILEGENPGDIAVTGGEPTLLVVNESAADRMGVTIPQSVLDRADEIITD
jgi:putative ABC transport system substrate-binding protein